MIFATVGSQMPFDRMIRALDEWVARQHERCPEVIAQIGDSQFIPVHMRSVPALSPTEFRQTVSRARLIVSHAGMGSVLTAMEFAKPLVIIPRQGSLRETRNDHQIATAHWLATKPGIFIAKTEMELGTAIERAEAIAEGLSGLSSVASTQLVAAISEFIHA